MAQSLSPLPKAPIPPLPADGMSMNAQLAQRLRHILDLYQVKDDNLATRTGIPKDDIDGILSGRAPITVAQLLKISEITGLHPLTFTDGVGAATPNFVHPAFMDQEAGDMALRFCALPKVGRALATAVIARGVGALT